MALCSEQSQIQIPCECGKFAPNQEETNDDVEQLQMLNNMKRKLCNVENSQSQKKKQKVWKKKETTNLMQTLKPIEPQTNKPFVWADVASD